MVRFLLVTTLIVSSLLPASAAEPALKKGQSLFSARAALLRDGWKPVETFDTDLDGNVLHSYNYAKAFYERGLKEVESCTGMEANYCGFNYRRKDRCLIFYTAGEYGAPGARYVPTVDNWWTYPLPSKRRLLQRCGA